LSLSVNSGGVRIFQQRRQEATSLMILSQFAWDKSQTKAPSPILLIFLIAALNLFLLRL
jgi:hypothetical protein